MATHLPTRSSLTSLRSFATHVPSLTLSLLPGLAFTLGLRTLLTRGELPSSVASLPWQIFMISAAGGIATTSGILDWIYHRTAGAVIGKNERKAELIALGCGGLPMFLSMSAATLARDPRPWLIPILILLAWTVALVAYDEVAFHRRRCAPVEHLLHRGLTLGHFVAFLAWMHLIFVRGLESFRGAGV